MDTSVICGMTKQVYKKHFKMRLNKAALKELTETQGGHSKVNSIKYLQLYIQEYLKSPTFSNSETELLFALRSHSVRVIKVNFSTIHKNNMTCLLDCENSKIDDQQHILHCRTLLSLLSSTELEIISTIKYEDIYSTVSKQKIVVSFFSRLLDLRNEIIQTQNISTTPTSGATTLDTAPPASQGSGGK